MGFLVVASALLPFVFPAYFFLKELVFILSKREARK